MSAPPSRFPTLYQINTRVLLHELGAGLGRPATLDDLPDALLEQAAERGFSWLWPLGVWQLGPAGRAVARQHAGVRAALARELPGSTEDDVVGSPFAIQAYEVDRALGGEAALARLRGRLAGRGIRLLLDFVPNHLAPDHPWIAQRPEYLIHGSAEDLAAAPQNYARFSSSSGGGPLILAHGRDPFFDGWTDTVQLNYRHAGLRRAQLDTLLAIAERCDGVRCDMAMLLEPSVIERTWGRRSLPVDGSPPDDRPFWGQAIPALRRRHPDFLLLAEVYWELEATLQQQGFDFTYDKRLYDRLRARDAPEVRAHLQAAPDFSQRCARFLENHDEPRAAAAFEPAVHRAAAVLAFFAPGMRLFHEGQLEGRRHHVSMQAARRLDEPIDAELLAFYQRLLCALARPEVHDGDWRLWPTRPAWEGSQGFESLIVSTWERGDRRLLVAVNYSGAGAQGYVTVALPEMRGRRWLLADLMSDACHERAGDDLAGAGLYLDLPPWGHHVFEMRPL